MEDDNVSDVIEMRMIIIVRLVWLKRKECRIDSTQDKVMEMELQKIERQLPKEERKEGAELQQ